MSNGRTLPPSVEKKRTDSPEARSGPVQGLLLIDKPAGMTSHDVVQCVRRVYGERSIGHLGTLDPFATGLLILLMGRATRLATFIDTEPKIYEAVVRFGEETDTDDATGTVIRTAPPPSERALQQSVARLTGSISQVPPAYSAKSVDGTRAYDAARRGEPLQLPAVDVTVRSWDIKSYRDGCLSAVISCSGGTYIRALARDLGRLTSSAAHLAALRRTRAGAFDVKDAATLDSLTKDPARVKWLRVVADA
jgi:tRNA pseudouridine55 synthase